MIYKILKYFREKFYMTFNVLCVYICVHIVLVCWIVASIACQMLLTSCHLYNMCTTIVILIFAQHTEYYYYFLHFFDELAVLLYRYFVTINYVKNVLDKIKLLKQVFLSLLIKYSRFPKLCTSLQM